MKRQIDVPEGYEFVRVFNRNDCGANSIILKVSDLPECRCDEYDKLDEAHEKLYQSTVKAMQKMKAELRRKDDRIAKQNDNLMGMISLTRQQVERIHEQVQEIERLKDCIDMLDGINNEVKK